MTFADDFANTRDKEPSIYEIAQSMLRHIAQEQAALSQSNPGSSLEIGLDTFAPKPDASEVIHPVTTTRIKAAMILAQEALSKAGGSTSIDAENWICHAETSEAIDLEEVQKALSRVRHLIQFAVTTSNYKKPDFLPDSDDTYYYLTQPNKLGFSLDNFIYLATGDSATPHFALDKPYTAVTGQTFEGTIPGPAYRQHYMHAAKIPQDAPLPPVHHLELDQEHLDQLGEELGTSFESGRGLAKNN